MYVLLYYGLLERGGFFFVSNVQRTSDIRKITRVIAFDTKVETFKERFERRWSASPLHSCTHTVDLITGNEVIPLNTFHGNWKVTYRGRASNFVNDRIRSVAKFRSFRIDVSFELSSLSSQKTFDRKRTRFLNNSETNFYRFEKHSAKYLPCPYLRLSWLPNDWTRLKITLNEIISQAIVQYRCIHYWVAVLKNPRQSFVQTCNDYQSRFVAGVVPTVYSSLIFVIFNHPLLNYNNYHFVYFLRSSTTFIHLRLVIITSVIHPPVYLENDLTVDFALLNLVSCSFLFSINPSSYSKSFFSGFLARTRSWIPWR